MYLLLLLLLRSMGTRVYCRRQWRRMRHDVSRGQYRPDDVRRRYLSTTAAVRRYYIIEFLALLILQTAQSEQSTIISALNVNCGASPCFIAVETVGARADPRGWRKGRAPSPNPKKKVFLFNTQK